ncbi:rhodanese-related sulfurtransferase [Metasolibacillus sp.]|uniref:oxygen-dependent tRNA uridine(34) hydroxylase TrhO n=1 Tax=Metasolibacillus sp. TaxID=2703680 RepID=UPI0025D7C04A|nr:rhodanese-related sulfurtransferase [Metasolibacillus sp.]MCT6922726.1 rhodanese-related sulfurtransferase [Metasolibacillus sp.]MCT6938935.1 rhodanese-related sulfurtransferase [Metasolibacillus sp.]
MKDYRVLLYYFYTTIEDPAEFSAQHLEQCKELELKGRILVATEGINGTVSGTIEATNAYMELMQNDPLFKGIVFKIDEVEGHAFKKMHVRPRPELVNLSLEDDVNPHEITGEYLSPAQFLEQMQREDTVVLDVRNTYEYDVGHFRGAIRPEVDNFRDTPQWVRENRELFEGKRVLTYCTGGIRCEKFSGWLKREGFEDVGQLHGGIATYGKDPETKGQLWDGQMYVFDERLTVPINQVEHVVVGRDHFDGTPCERYINCANPECNKQILTSEENEAKHLGGCTIECTKHERNRYIVRHNLTEEQVQQAIAALEQV